MLRRTGLAAAIGALLALSACSGGTTANTDGKDGVAMGPGVTDKEIRIGLLTDYSGPIAEAATSGSLGSEVYYDTVNANGGVCGRKLVAVKKDTKYDPQQTTQAYRSLSNDVLMIGQLLGSSSVDAIKTSIERDNIPTMAISLTTATLGQKDIYVPLPVFETEEINGLVWAAEQAGATDDKPLKVAIVTEAGAAGEADADALKYAAKDLPVEIVAAPTYTGGSGDFTPQVTELKKSGAEVVVLATGPGDTAGFVGTAAQFDFKPTWVGPSGSWFAALAEPLKGLLDKYYVSAGYGTLDDDVPGITALKDALAKYAPDAKPSNFQVGGWLVAQAAVAGLEKACADKDLTRDGLVKALEDLKVDYQGIAPEIDLGTGDTIVSHYSRMNTIGPDGELVPVGDFFETDQAKAWAESKGL